MHRQLNDSGPARPGRAAPIQPINGSIASFVPNTIREEPLKRLKRIFRGQSGQDMVEYGLLAATLSIVALSALLYFSPVLKSVYYSVQDAARRAATATSGNTGSGGRGGEAPSD